MTSSCRRVSIAISILIFTGTFVVTAHARDRYEDAGNRRVSVVLKPSNGAVRLASLERLDRLQLRGDVEPEVAHEEAGKDASELKCLARAIYFEARGESVAGRTAVGSVILNRTHSSAYPDTICGVVYQNAQRMNRCQFSFACDGVPDVIDERKAWDEIEDLAERLLTECGPPSAPVLVASTHYHARSVNPRWARKLTVTGEIGQHIFYRDESI